MTPEPAPQLYDCAADLDEDFPPPAEERTRLTSARPRVRFCRRTSEA
jgi:hypothetical protein